MHSLILSHRRSCFFFLIPNKPHSRDLAKTGAGDGPYTWPASTSLTRAALHFFAILSDIVSVLSQWAKSIRPTNGSRVPAAACRASFTTSAHG